MKHLLQWHKVAASSCFVLIFFRAFRPTQASLRWRGGDSSSYCVIVRLSISKKNGILRNLGASARQFSSLWIPPSSASRDLHNSGTPTILLQCKVRYRPGKPQCRASPDLQKWETRRHTTPIQGPFTKPFHCSKLITPFTSRRSGPCEQVWRSLEYVFRATNLRSDLTPYLVDASLI